MAILYAEGFECGVAAALVTQGWSIAAASIGTTSAHKDMTTNGGLYAMASSNGNVNQFSPNPSFDSTTARWVSFAMSAGGKFAFLLGATYQMTLRFTQSSSVNVGLLQLRLGNESGTVVATATTMIPAGVHWFEVELVAKEAAGGGLCNIYVDQSSTPIIAYVGDCRNAAADGFDRIGFGGGTGTIYLDDVVVSTTRIQKELYLKNCPATANDVVTGTPSAGTNWQCVDEVPVNTTDYVEWVAAGSQDTYSHAGLGYTPQNILGVQVANYFARDGVVAGFQNVLKSGATTATSATNTVATIGTFTWKQTFWETDPDTSSTWTLSAVNAADFGCRTA
jgi:hypothetical protein